MAYEKGGSLAEAWKTRRGDRYAVCHPCHVVYKDDVQSYGSIYCPTCEGALFRGLTAIQAKELTEGFNSRRK